MPFESSVSACACMNVCACMRVCAHIHMFMCVCVCACEEGACVYAIDLHAIYSLIFVVYSGAVN